MNAPRLLALNAAAQIIFASLLGFAMLVPLQPWGQSFGKLLRSRLMTAAHLDWLMLAFMQAAAAFVLDRWPVGAGPARVVAVLLVAGGWMNPVPYVLKAAGVDAFVLAGPPRQKVAAAIAGLSSLAILAAWVALLAAEVARGP
jgi:hypothetical protein